MNEEQTATIEALGRSLIPRGRKLSGEALAAAMKLCQLLRHFVGIRDGGRGVGNHAEHRGSEGGVAGFKKGKELLFGRLEGALPARVDCVEQQQGFLDVDGRNAGGLKSSAKERANIRGRFFHGRESGEEPGGLAS